MKTRALLFAAVIVGGFVYFTSRISPVRTFLKTDGPLWTGPSVAHSAGLSADETNNIDIYKASKDSVVYITSTVYQRDFFFDVVPVKELGSGFILNADGEILTNNHVISGSSQLEVTLPGTDHTTYKARILVRNSGNDLALIKIEPKAKLKF